MRSLYRSVWLWLVLCSLVVASESFIVLSYGEKNKMLEEQTRHVEFAQNNDISPLNVSLEKISDNYTLQLGPYKRTEALALTYMKIKEHFHDAVIIEKKVAVFYLNLLFRQ